ncbi:MAG: DASH family cryptochrome [Alkalinema sp. RU_4_3]|nr:DASH family cryptochrome [Alkalinema sp. RU_4_3]
MQDNILVWLRNDLRLHDHRPLQEALRKARPIMVYCVDPRQFGTTSMGFAKTGVWRSQFLLESLADLRENLKKLGSDLVIRLGKPEEILPALVVETQAIAIHYHEAVGTEEDRVELNVENSVKVDFNGYWGHTLYSPDELPFNLMDLPELFTKFRKLVEKEADVERAIAAPTKLPPLPEGLDPGRLPTLEDLNVPAPTPSSLGVLSFKGGESAAIDRLQTYFWKNDCLKTYKETRNDMLGADYSSKFSPWLAMGCLSPRYVHGEVLRYERERVENESTYWLIFELLWRDYFQFICFKHGAEVFKKTGLLQAWLPWKDDPDRFELWKTGMTGFPLVDANMRELAATGFMSNRGRQNVASFLTKNLGIDWRQGAAYFESILIDYDVCSNWGNWNYSAGVGNDARGFRFFNITKQAKDYDPQGDYVRHWCPELATLPATKIHEPWKLDPAEQKQFAVRLGVDYPNPVVDLFASAAANELAYNGAMGIESPDRSQKPIKRGRN